MAHKTTSDILLALNHFGNITENRVEEFDALIAEVVGSLDESLIMPLAMVLDDGCEFDEVMFGVVHALEKFPLSAYLEVLASNINLIYEKAPRWSEILHTRIMNSEKAYDVFLKKFSTKASDVKNFEIDLLRGLAKKDRFRDRCLVGIRQIESFNSDA